MPPAPALITALASLAGLAACTGATPPAASPAPFYQLACDSADTTEASTLYCVRTDTRDGDVLIVDLDRVPITSGSSRGVEEPAGTYQTVCDATVTPQRSDFRCVRLHVRTGDVVLLELGELPRWPAPR